MRSSNKKDQNIKDNNNDINKSVKEDNKNLNNNVKNSKNNGIIMYDDIKNKIAN